MPERLAERLAWELWDDDGRELPDAIACKSDFEIREIIAGTIRKALAEAATVARGLHGYCGDDIAAKIEAL